MRFIDDDAVEVTPMVWEQMRRSLRRLRLMNRFHKLSDVVMDQSRSRDDRDRAYDLAMRCGARAARVVS